MAEDILVEFAKYLTYTLKDVYFILMWNFKSSYIWRPVGIIEMVPRSVGNMKDNFWFLCIAFKYNLDIYLKNFKKYQA